MRSIGLTLCLWLGFFGLARAGDDLSHVNGFTALHTGPTSLYLQGTDGSSIEVLNLGSSAYFIETDRNGHQTTGTIYNLNHAPPADYQPLRLPETPPPVGSLFLDPLLRDPLGLGRP